MLRKLMVGSCFCFVTGQKINSIGGYLDMIVGVPKEIKNNENRVALTPAGVTALIQDGQKVLVEKSAGAGSGFSDESYAEAGAKILESAKEVFDGSDMIVKVKEPLPQEYTLFKEGQVLFTYLHLAPEKELTRVLLEKKIVGIAYETVQMPNGSLPLLAPMSEIAGRMSVQVGAHFLAKQYGGKGVLLSGVPGVPPARVTVVGGGVVGANAAVMAVGLGADVTIVEKNPDRLRELDTLFGFRAKTLMSNSYNLMDAVAKSDLLIGAVLLPGAKAPKLVTEEMVMQMNEGSVIVDVAIDQGGCVESVDRITTHDNPTFIKHGVVHYSVANMPGALARTSTLALTNATLPYVLKLAAIGYKDAITNDQAVFKGVNVYNGKVTCKEVADALGFDYIPLNQLLN
ncbi:alanine dehydrogenase [Desulfocucumis palustris]|uniref:Alanine dehydrogenase n=2 Tax=Desulfocucumis palustris TaxID=1898651 RepID=A0A2L2XJJ2_9FIRM|nr:alanine dehydrogenase [Desulfocucumis palustris]